MHLNEGVCLNALLTAELENHFIYLAGAPTPTVFMMELQFILHFKLNKKIKPRNVVVVNKMF